MVFFCSIHVRFPMYEAGLKQVPQNKGFARYISLYIKIFDTIVNVLHHRDVFIRKIKEASIGRQKHTKSISLIFMVK